MQINRLWLTQIYLYRFYIPDLIRLANDVESNYPGPNVDSATCMFTPCDEGSQKFMCSIINLPLAVKHCLKPSKPLSKPSKLIHILGDGNCLFRALSYAVSGRQVYHTQMRMQIINHMYHIEHFLLPHMNRSLNSYLANSHMTRNGVWGTDIEIFSAASLLSTDILFTPNLTEGSDDIFDTKTLNLAVSISILTLRVQLVFANNTERAGLLWATNFDFAARSSNYQLVTHKICSHLATS